MNLASKMLVLLSANMSLATHCATIKGEMFKCFLFKKRIPFSVTVHNGALVLFYYKAVGKPGQCSEKLSPGIVPVPPEV